MAVDPNIDELLQRLSQVKPLPQTEQPFRTLQARAGSQVRDASLNAFQNTPRLADAVQAIQQGGSAQTGWKGAVARAVGSPVGKAVLGGLNVIDMPRRAVISAAKEIDDLIDVDPNSRASLKDFRQQFRDPTFGFGRLAPMEGWKGRIVGLIGDIALDPTTYLTLGATVPTKAVAMGARRAGEAGLLRAGAKVGLEDVGLRAALGTKNVSGREGRFALANLVKNYGGTAEEVARVASRGKSAVPDDIARVLGLQRNGLYMFGSRVRLPGTGIVGSALEAGLVKTRLAITNTNIGKKLQYLYTPRGASGRLGDLSKLRADMASGRLKPEEVDLIMTQLNGAENGRRVGASYGSQSAREASSVANLDEVKEFSDQIAGFIESGKDEFLSPSQAAAKRAVEAHFERQAQIIEGLMKRVDPSWELPRIRDPQTGQVRYVPHVTTDKFRRWKDANLDNPWVQRLEQYLSVDVLDMKNNLAARYFKAGSDFLDSGKIIQTGSIDELNTLFKQVVGVDFDMFEKDIGRIMFGYADTVRGAAEVATLLSDLKSADFIRLLRNQGEIDPEYLRALERMTKDKLNEVERLSGRLRGAANSVVDEVKKQFGTDFRTSIASRLVSDIPEVAGEVRAAGRVVDAGVAAQAKIDSLMSDIDNIISQQKIQVAALSASFEEKNLVMDLMRLYVDESIEAGFRFGQEVQAFRRVLEDATADREAVKAAYEKFEGIADETKRAISKSEDLLKFYKQFGDDLGPVLKDIYGRIRDAAYDGDLNRLFQEGERFKSTGDEKLNVIVSMLLKPFDNQNYANAGGLGDEWTKTTVTSSGEAGRLLKTIPDIRGGKVPRASMGKKGGKRTLTISEARDILVRGSMVGDNPEDMSDAFYFLTLSELKAAYDNAGGGELGVAAQNALAKELRSGVTSRSKLWLEAREAAKRVVKDKEALDVIGSRRTQAGGRYSRETMDRMEALRAEIEEASVIQDAQVSDSLTRLGSAMDLVEADSSPDNVFAFLEGVENILATLKARGVDQLDQGYVALTRVNKVISDKVLTNEQVTSQQMRTFYDEIEKFVRVEFGDTERVARLSREMNSLERFAKDSFEIDKQFNDGVTGLTGSVIDAGTKLSNFLTLHVARLSVDAIQKMTPSGVEVGEAIWGFAVAGAARQQMQTLLDFGRNVREAEQVMLGIRDKVLGAPARDRATILRDEVRNLPAPQRRAVYSVVGNLSFIEQAERGGRRPAWYYRNNEIYVAVRDAVLDAYDPGWKNITDDISNMRRTARVRGRAVTATGAAGASAGEFRGGTDLGVVAGEMSSALRNAQNKQRKYMDSSPEKLREYVLTATARGSLDGEDMRRLLAQIDEADKAVNAQRKMDEIRPEFGPEFPTEQVAGTRRELSRAAKGAKRAETEAFGLARAFSLAVQTNESGATRSNTRINEFFTYLFGDGKVRIGTGESSTRKPVSQRTAEEATFRAQVDTLFANARKNAADRRRAKMDPVQNALRFWDEVGASGVVDSERAKNIVMSIDSTKASIADLKKVIAGMQREPDRVGLAGEIAANKQRVGVLSQRVKDMEKELTSIENTSKQLITLGTGSENAYRTIAYKDSQFGKMGERIERRSSALKDLVIDPEAAGNVSDLSIGIGKRARFGTGPYGYLEYLNSRVNELDAAIAEYESAVALTEKAERKLGRASAQRQQAVRDAEAIANNPVLERYVDAAITDSKEVLYPRKAKWLDASLLGQEYVNNPQAGVKTVIDGEEVVQPAKIPSVYIPERVASLINRSRNARLKIESIESSPLYTRALQMENEHNFFKLLAKIDLDRTGLEFPETAYTSETIADLRRFAASGSGVQAGLNPDSIEVRRVIERNYEEVAGKLLSDKSGRYAVVVDGRRATRQSVVDSIKARDGRKFSYRVELVSDPNPEVRFKDKSTGAIYSFDPAATPEQVTAQGIDVELDQPVYMRDSMSRDRDDFVALLDPSRRNTVYEVGDVVNAGGAADNFYDPNNTIVTFASSVGSQRVYKMNEMSVTQQRSTSLAPEVVFSQADGRGLTKESFEALFSEPLNPASKKARKMREDIAKAGEVRDDFARRYNEYRKAARNARTEKARRNAQALAAQVEESIREQDAFISELELRYRATEPSRHMASVQMALNVLEYFKNPEVRKSLGIRIDRRATGVDPVNGMQIFEFVPASDEEALAAFKKYVEALEYGKTRKYLKRTKIEDPETKRFKSVVVDEKEPMVLESERNKRLSYLNKKWKESDEKALLDSYKESRNIIAATSKELDTIKNGGDAAALYRELNAARAERDALQAQVGIKERNVKKALRQASPRVSVRQGEQIATVAKGVLGERQDALDNAIVGDLLKSVPAEQRAAVAAKLEQDRTRFLNENFHATIARDMLVIAEAAEKAQKEKLDRLLLEESRIMEKIGAMTSVLEGRPLGPNAAKQIPEEYAELRLRLNGNPRYKVRGLKQEINDAQKQLDSLYKQRLAKEAEVIQLRSAVDMSFYANLTKAEAETRMNLIKETVADMKEVRKAAKKPGKKDQSWTTEFDDFVAEVDDLLQRVKNMPEGPDTDRLAKTLTGYLEAKAAYLRAEADVRDVEEMQRLVDSGRLFAEGDHVIFRKVLDEGWQKLVGGGALTNFNNLQMRPEVAEVLKNMQRLRDPGFVREMRRWTGPYTKFFKAWALATPGFHVRNSITNAFMLVAAGGNPRFLGEAMVEYNKMYKALKEGMTAERYIAERVPRDKQRLVRDAYDAMLGSGVGQAEEVAFDTAGLLSNNPWTRMNRRAGVWVEQHSRFMLAYDGIRQGLDVNGATARVRKYLFDYEDISKLDATMRSIVPFWMWMSRNFPLTIQNIYMNPRPYQFYNNIQRNLKDEEETKSLPQYLLEAGAFALPGGGMIATPDLGFNRLQADVAQLTDPMRFASNVNPLFRVPVETMLANRQFFRDREFSEAPVEAANPVAGALSALGQPFGLGGTDPAGNRVVNEKLYYALRNLVPVAAQFERFVPSTTEYQQRGTTNPLLGFIGAPVREFTPEMRTSELRRRLQEIAQLQRAQPKVEE